MNNKLKLISLAVISTFILVACNGGNSNSNGQQTDADTVPPVAGDISLDAAAPGAGAGLLSMLGGGVVSAIGGQVALWLLEKVTGGAFPPNNTPELISGISTQLTQIQEEISAQNAYTDNLINTYQAENAYSTIKNNYITIIGGFYSKIGQFIQQANHCSKFPDISQSDLNTAYEAFNFQSSAPFESMILKAMSTKNNQNTLVGQTTSFSNLDNAATSLTCDTPNGKYNSLNPSNYPTPNLNLSYAAGQGCQIALVLQAALSNFTNMPITTGNNAFYTYTSFSAGLDIFYLTMVNSLTQEYAIDQLRAYLGQFKNSIIGFPDYVSNVNSYQSALNDVTLAYNSRLGYLNTMFSEAKELAFNYITQVSNSTESINSLSMQTQCNLTPQGIESNVPANLSTSQASSLYSWDGSNLKVTCSSNDGQLTTTTSIAALCQNADLQANNGYISCGHSIDNYAFVKAYTNPTVYDMAQFLFLIDYTNITSYNVDPALAYFSMLYGFWSTGTLDVYYDSAYPITSNSFSQTNSAFTTSPTIYTLSSTGFNVLVNPSSLGDGDAGGVPALVSDEVHTFIIGAGAIHHTTSNNEGYMILNCIPGDSNCQVGSFPNSTTPSETYNALIFRNGDVITMYNKNQNGDYYLQNYYNGTAAQQVPDILNAVSW